MVFAVAPSKGESQKFNITHVGYLRFRLVHSQEQFLLDERSDVLVGSVRKTGTLPPASFRFRITTDTLAIG